ncbi:unnamed protein product [Adineta ricciae]|uniref:Uncharacterized protein n=1 Tax=Adineta ricciae TaxID=249248 RepID=A0A815GDW4_ADIRI|nr:unnamed protein product [Adineta ricciae]
MGTTMDSTDLYTLWKHDEQLQHRQTFVPSISNAIPFKSDSSKFLVPSFSQVFYTNGYSPMKEDHYYERTLFDEEMEVPTIGTDRKNFDIAETITFDINGASTRLPLMCKMIIYQQGAAHEREPPIMVRDVCVQWNGLDRPRSQSSDNLTSFNDNILHRTRSSDYLLDGSVKSTRRKCYQNRNRCLSMASSATEDDDDTASIITAGGTIQHRVSHLLQRHKYSRQIDTNILGRNEFYSVPFYQYRGRRYGQNDVATQTIESDSLDDTLRPSDNRSATTYSVTIILSVSDGSRSSKHPKIYQVNIPMDNRSNHTTVGYINTKQFVTIKRTFHGQDIDV